MATQIKLRRDTYQNWYDNNPILGQGEPAYDLTNNKLKIGDGLTAWRLLPYFDDKETNLSSVAQDIVPDADNTRDLGSPTKQWRHVYTAGGSIYLDNIKLTNNAGKLEITKVINPGEENEEPDPDDSEADSDIRTISVLTNDEHTFELMSDGTLELDGVPYNPGGGADLGDFTIDGSVLEAEEMTIKTNDADLIIDSDSDVVVRSSGGNHEWQFNTSGNLELPEGGDIVDHLGNSVLGGGGPGLGNISFDASGNSAGIYNSQGGEVIISNFSFITEEAETAYVRVPAGNSSNSLQIVQEQGSVEIFATDKIWEFSSNGALRLPAGGDILNSSGQSVLGGGSNTYTPDDPDDWNSPTVNTVQAALDELAAKVAALQNFEIDGGNAYTPEAGELLIDGNGA